MEFSLEFELITLLVIAAVTVSQAIFGVGILLWGTPIFLLLGKDFPQTLELLLPLSLLLSAVQFIPNREKIDRSLLSQFLLYSLLGIILGLSFIISYNVKVDLLVAIILCSSVLFKLQFFSEVIINLKRKHDKAFMFLIGLVHGVSNLGGPLLVLRVSLEGLEKDKYRALTAAIYFIFAATQLLVLSFKINHLEISLIYPTVVIGTYVISNRYIFKNIKQSNFDKLITILLLCMGSLLLFKLVSGL